MRPGPGTGFARSHGKLGPEQNREPKCWTAHLVYSAHSWPPSVTHRIAEPKPNSSVGLWALPMEGREENPPPFQQTPPLCSLYSSTHLSLNGLSLPCLEVASDLVIKVVVSWSKLLHWHRRKQILPSNSFPMYKYTFVIKILYEAGDLMFQFACTLGCSEKLDFQLLKSWLLLTFHN